MTTLRQASGKTAPHSADARALDEALDETFPASDPIAVKPDASEAQTRAMSAQAKTSRPPTSSKVAARILRSSPSGAREER